VAVLRRLFTAPQITQDPRHFLTRKQPHNLTRCDYNDEAGPTRMASESPPQSNISGNYVVRANNRHRIAHGRRGSLIRGHRSYIAGPEHSGYPPIHGNRHRVKLLPPAV
jgi:hypothetical protein